MEDIDSKIFKDFYEIIHMANYTWDHNLLRHEILMLLHSRIYTESSIFFLSEKGSMSRGGIEISLVEKYVRQYKEYYNRFDPIRLIRGAFSKKNVVQLEELIGYHFFVSSPFYCDFLVPQKIHHKLYPNLVAGGRFKGRIALYGPPKSGRLSKEEVNTLRIIFPYLACALDFMG